MSTIESPVLIFNPHMPLIETAEPQRSKVDLPDPVSNLLQADVFTDATAREHPSGMALVQQREKLLAAPARVPAPGVEDRGHDLLGRVPRRVPRPARALLQPGRPVRR